jgi:hypothetical protein
MIPAYVAINDVPSAPVTSEPANDSTYRTDRRDDRTDLLQTLTHSSGERGRFTVVRVRSVAYGHCTVVPPKSTWEAYAWAIEL